MKEYICKDEVLNIIKKLPQDLHEEYIYELKGFWCDDDEIIQADPVVRCKECDSYVELAWWFDDEGKKKECHCCVAHSIPVQPNDFCSYGERREP